MSEPVAWMNPKSLECGYGGEVDWEDTGCIPLYTHPVKEQLTDEVKDALMDALSGWKYIRECHGDLYGVGWDRVQDKLEAILRKAQEK